MRVREALLIGAMALSLAGCDFFSTSGDIPTPAPIVFQTPTPYTGPTAAPIPFQTVEPTASATGSVVPSLTPGPIETSTATSVPTPTDTPVATAPAPMPTETPVVAQSPSRQEEEAAGTPAYGSYYDTSAPEGYLDVGETVVAECVLFVQNPMDVGQINAWYRLDSPSGPHGEALYAAAGTFANPGSQSPSGQNDTYDPYLAVCPDSPLPPQVP